MKTTQRARGFTLIELMIVCAIITILAGISLAYSGNFTQEEQLRELSRAVVAICGQARGYSTRTGAKAMVNFGTSQITAFVDNNGDFIPNATDYIIAQYPQTGSYSSNFHITTSTTNGTALTTGNPSAAMTAIFDFQGYVVTSTGAAMQPTICVKNPALNDTRAIQLTMAGTSRISIYSAGKALCP